MDIVRYLAALAMSGALLVACESEPETPQLDSPAIIAMQDAGKEPQKVELYDSVLLFWYPALSGQMLWWSCGNKVSEVSWGPAAARTRRRQEREER